MKKMMIVPAVVVVILVGLVVWRGVGEKQATATNTNRIRVETSLDFYAEMARAVGGDAVSVHSAINSTAIDPHDYEPDASTAKRYAAAALTLSNGGGYDDWSVRLGKQNTTAKRIVVATVTGWQAGQNEHLWFKPDMAAKLVARLERELSAIRPAARAQFKRNGAAYLKKLAPLRKLQLEAKSQLKGTNYLATEPVYDNTLASLGATNQSGDFAESVEEGNDPTARELTNWQTDIKSGRIAFVINNPQNSGRVVQQAVKYAQQHGVPVINVTETKPAGLSYRAWQQQPLRKVLHTLK